MADIQYHAFIYKLSAYFLTDKIYLLVNYLQQIYCIPTSFPGISLYLVRYGHGYGSSQILCFYLLKHEKTLAPFLF